MQKPPHMPWFHCPGRTGRVLHGQGWWWHARSQEFSSALGAVAHAAGASIYQGRVLSKVLHAFLNASAQTGGRGRPIYVFPHLGLPHDSSLPVTWCPGNSLSQSRRRSGSAACPRYNLTLLSALCKYRHSGNDSVEGSQACNHDMGNILEEARLFQCMMTGLSVRCLDQALVSNPQYSMFSVGVVLDCHARWVPKAMTRVIMSAGREGIFSICDKLDAAWRGDFADRGFKLGDARR